jgi:exonuclease III
MKILSWNARGLGDDDKNETICKSIDEAKVDIVCLQETKLTDITVFKAKKFLPAKFTNFEYHPSDGASAGLLIAWNPREHNVRIIDSKKHALTVEIDSTSDDTTFVLTNVYAPCDQADRSTLFNELKLMQVSITKPWVLAGDFNIYRYVSEKNNSNIN